jgi:GNAT superfamily N-acetyltransferase
MAYGLPNMSFIGYPVSVPCAGHAGLGFREARQPDAAAIVTHYASLGPHDRRMRFCATLTDDALERHVAGLWTRGAVVLVAVDGPLWPGPLHRAGPFRAVAELSLAAREAELGLSVDSSLRRRGVGTYLVQTAAALLAPRGIRRLHAYTVPGNGSFLALARGSGASIELGHEEVEVEFDLLRLQQAYLRRRAADALPARRPMAPARFRASADQLGVHGDVDRLQRL